VAARSYKGAARTFNLTVDAVHTYYVLAGHVPVLVHNANSKCRPIALGKSRVNGDPMEELALKTSALGIYTVAGRRFVVSSVRGGCCGVGGAVWQQVVAGEVSAARFRCSFGVRIWLAA
jgi:hypothetical protein